MRCDAFERWLDEGMPAAGAEAALAHARACAACAASLTAARAVEAALRTAPPAAPGGFTDAVMARIAGVEPLASEPVPAAVPRAPWWVEIGSEPALWVGAGLAAALAVAWSASPGAVGALTGVAETAASAWVGAASAWTSRLPSLLVPIDPTQRAALELGLALPALWLLYRAPIWLVDSWTRRGRTSPRPPASRPRSPR
ncbi:MAG: hypothetical protein ACM3JJ_04565 [Hyphomicrobiales bacterium]